MVYTNVKSAKNEVKRLERYIIITTFTQKKKEKLFALNQRLENSTKLITS